MTHFATASDINNNNTMQQFNLFKHLLDGIEHNYLLSTANSAAILNWPDTHLDVIRPGIMLYGISPFKECVGADHGLRPVMSLETEIIAIHMVKKGQIIGYDARYICKQDQKIGIIAIGYGDGYPKCAPDGTPVLVNGVQASIAGKVSMDMISIDLSTAPTAKIGDKVLLWGQGLPIETVATAINGSSYELVTSLTPRVPRVAVRAYEKVT
jgi:alanine racemase